MLSLSSDQGVHHSIPQIGINVVVHKVEQAEQFCMYVCVCGGGVEIVIKHEENSDFSGAPTKDN